MKIKTSELTGRALDWAVATALGWRLVDDEWRGAPSFEGDTLGRLVADENWSPSQWWEDGGPLIEREKAAVDPDPHASDERAWIAGVVKRYGHEGPESDHWKVGCTPLVAAMRAIVAAKLGEEVDVPEELWKV